MCPNPYHDPYAAAHVPRIRWIIVANQSEARFFEQDLRSLNIEFLHKIEHPEGRMRNQDLKTDRSGRAFSSWSGSRSSHGMETKLSPQQKQAEVFAGQINDQLRKGFHENRFDEIELVAEPQFMGSIFAQLDKNVKRAVKEKVTKDLAYFSDHEVKKYLMN